MPTSAPCPPTLHVPENQGRGRALPVPCRRRKKLDADKNVAPRQCFLEPVFWDHFFGTGRVVQHVCVATRVHTCARALSCI
eukprot:2666309-Lingulodinium_polyedra.AAC.1